MSGPRPEITALSAPYWDGLRDGELRFQHCSACGFNWLPAREACTACLAPEPQWRRADGRARLVSWVVYHTAYHEAFRDRLPYNVACVELIEGPRLLSSIVEANPRQSLTIDADLVLQIENEGGLALPRFRLLTD